MMESLHRKVKISVPGRYNLGRHIAGNIKSPDLDVIQCIKRAPEMSPFPLVPSGPLGSPYSYLAKRGRTGAKTKRERRSRSNRSGSWFLRR